jgi:hypothetical protein
LEQDLPAGVPLVLCVSDIRTSGGGSSHKHSEAHGHEPQEQQQQQAGSAAVPDVLSIQLTDGWYHVNACIDAPLCALINAGQLQVRWRLACCPRRLAMSNQQPQAAFAAEYLLCRVSARVPAGWHEGAHSGC